MDASTSKDILGQLLSLGLPGVIIIVQGYMVMKLFNLLQTANEARITETRSVVEAMAANATALEQISKVVEKRT